MMTKPAVAVLGIDLGKNSCSVGGLDDTGRVVLRRRLSREGVVRLAANMPTCVMAMEACCGAHHLGRVLREHGHEVRLMSPEYVQPYVKAQKNDERDAEAIAEAATRPTMRFVELKSENANCQTLVSLTLASGEVPIMVGLRLFLPESWTSDPARLARARVPEDFRGYRTKPEIALAEIDRARTSGLRFGCVLADAGYGLSAPFRQALSARGLTWAVSVGARQKVYPVDVALIFPVAGRGRPRKNHVPDAKSVSAEKTLAMAPWRTLSWRRGTKGPLKARFAAVRIKVADGPPQRIGDMGQQHLPGEEAWLIGEHRSNGERKYYLSNLPADTSLKRLAGAIKARWICEQAPQQLKEELGLDHFEGRSWTGLHRHALMTMIAYAFLQSRRLKQAKREKKNPGPAASADPASGPRGHHRGLRRVTINTMSARPPLAQL